MKKAVNKYPLYAFLLTAIVWVLILIICNVLGNGNTSILKGDLFEQYIPFIVNATYTLKGDESVWYSFSNYIGSGNILNIAYYCLNPLNLLFLFEALGFENIVIIIIAVKLSLASMTFYMYIRKVTGKQLPVYIIMSLYYGLSGFSIAYHFNIMWLDALYILPLLLYFLIDIFKKNNSAFLIITYLYLFITNFYMGYMAGIFTAFFFIILCIKKRIIEKSIDNKALVRITLKYIYSVLVAIGISSIVTLPTLGFLINHIAKDNIAFSNELTNPFEIINMFFTCQVQTMDNKYPFVFCGIFVFALGILYLLKKEYGRERILYLCGIIALIAAMCVLPLYKFMNAFDNPDYYGYRFSYMLSLIVITMACIALSSINSSDLKFIRMIIIGLVLVYCIFFFVNRSADKPLYENSIGGLFINIIILISSYIVLSFYLKYKDDNRKSIFMFSFLLFIFVAEIIINGYCQINNDRIDKLNDEYIDRWYFTQKEDIDLIKENDNSFYRIYVNYEQNINSSKLFGFNSYNTFSSADNFEMRQGLSKLGLSVANRAIMSHCNIPGFDMLFGTKYLLDYSKDDNRIAINNRVLSLGYMVNDSVKDYGFTSDSFSNIDNLISSMLGENIEIFSKYSLNDANISIDNVDFSYLDNRYVFKPLDMSKDGGYVVFTLSDIKNPVYMNIYMNVPGYFDNSANIVCREEGYSYSMPAGMGGIYKLNELDDVNSGIGIQADSNSKMDFFVDNITFASVNDENIDYAYNELAKNQLEITENKGSIVKGTVTATDEKNILFTTIPFEPEWRVYVDGVECDALRLCGDAFIGVELEKGQHNIEFRYVEKYAEFGKILTIISCVLLTCTLVSQCIKRKKQ